MYDILAGQSVPRRLINLRRVELCGGVADKTLQHVVKAIPPRFGGSLRKIDPDQCKIFGQHSSVRQIIERGHNQALREIAARAEYHHRAGISGREFRSIRRSQSEPLIIGHDDAPL